MTQALQVCRTSIAQHSKSFAMASRLLPEASRDAAAVVYAWCRRADDAIDFAEGEEQQRALVELKRELSSIYAGEVQTDLVLRAFQEVVQRHAVPETYPAELLAGMEMDAHGHRYDTWDDLLLYCYRVASTVGLMMCHVMGVRDAAALPHAAHLGVAMQLTNIARDVKEDWDRGRLYLPDELLRAYCMDWLRDRLGQPFPQEAQAGCRAVLANLLATADRYYESADQGLPYLSARAELSVAAARKVYSAIGVELRKQRYDVLAGRAHVSKLKKVVLCLEAALSTAWRRRGVFQPEFQPARLRAVHYGPDLIVL